MEKKKVALVMSSGGARGLVHIGVIEELLDEGYEISSIAGSSMGSLVGGMYAAGGLEAFSTWMKSMTKRKMVELADLSLSINHVVKGERIINALKEIVPDVKIEDLPIPYCAVATDWLNGCETVFRKGSLFDAIRASISIPFFFSPVQRDGMILMDGGVLNPIPLNRVVRTEGDLLMGVDVSKYNYEEMNEEQHINEAESKQKNKHSRSLARLLLNKIRPDNIELNYMSILSRTAILMMRENSVLMEKLARPDIMLDIEMKNYSLFDYDKAEELIAIGRKQAREILSGIRKE